jgi:fatty acid synthase subunit alpha, fungi type
VSINCPADLNTANIVTSVTALQSLEIACDTILSGKAKVMIAGGFDDISEEGSCEFANMKATSNAETEFAMGREPTEMSRPTTTTRAGVSGNLNILELS